MVAIVSPFRKMSRQTDHPRADHCSPLARSRRRGGSAASRDRRPQQRGSQRRPLLRRASVVRTARLPPLLGGRPRSRRRGLTTIELQLNFPAQGVSLFDLVPGDRDVYNLTHWALLSVSDSSNAAGNMDARHRKLAVPISRYDAPGGVVEGRFTGTLFPTTNARPRRPVLMGGVTKAARRRVRRSSRATSRPDVPQSAARVCRSTASTTAPGPGAPRQCLAGAREDESSCEAPTARRGPW